MKETIKKSDDRIQGETPIGKEGYSSKELELHFVDSGTATDCKHTMRSHFRRNILSLKLGFVKDFWETIRKLLQS